MKTKPYAIKLLPLIGVFLVLTTSQGLSQWIVEDPGAIAELGTANGTLIEISQSSARTASATEDIQRTNQQIIEFLNQNIGMPSAATGAGTTAGAIQKAQMPPVGGAGGISLADNELSTILKTAKMTSKMTALTGNQNQVGQALYSNDELPSMPTMNPLALKKLPNLMKPFAGVEEAVANYSSEAGKIKKEIDNLEKELAKKMQELNTADNDAKVQKLHAAISGINTEIAALNVELNMALAHVNVVLGSNDTEEKKRAIISTFQQQDKDAATAMGGALTFGLYTF
ncbi:MAG: hypothetical protein K1X66_04745 [Verrucomicrobiae bacterium]|nr:hypothetical protein [Verrucomicrobiae bacterium]